MNHIPVILLLPAALLSFSALPASAAIRRVNRNATGTNNGTSWANAYPTLQAAVTAAVSGDQIWIAAGTYRPNDTNPGNTSRGLSFSMKRGVSIYGGFAGTETTVNERDPKLNPVILSGDLLGNDSAGNLDAYSSDDSKAENVYHVIYNSSSQIDSSAVLDSVTIRGGNTAGASSNATGGGIYNFSSSPTIANCMFVDNSATNGGAVCNSQTRPSSPSFKACTFSHNKATSFGGAVYNNYGDPILINCTLTENQGTHGGAIFNQTANLMAINCTVAFNSSDPDIPESNATGSGIRSVIAASSNLQSHIYLYNCILWGNRNSVQLVGGGMMTSNCIIEGGSAKIVSEVLGNTFTNISDSDPQLTPLGDHGGVLPTIVYPATSPAINAGTTSTGLSSYPIPGTDQRGFPRDAQPDIGATEHPVYGGAAPGQVAIGGSATLPVSTALPAPTFQWYRGTTGDKSDPIAGATGASYPTPPLDLGADYWAEVSSAGETYASPTISVPVRGTYAQWVTFHGLQNEDAATGACPAGDGVPNLIKYAAGISPFSAAGQAAGLRTSIDPATGNVLLDLTLSRTPTDLTRGILESQNLQEWTPTTGTTSPVATSTARETQRLNVQPSQSAVFYKVRFQTSD